LTQVMERAPEEGTESGSGKNSNSEWDLPEVEDLKPPK
jgi:hypothetical protein